jgi:hypothetical protein
MPMLLDFQEVNDGNGDDGGGSGAVAGMVVNPMLNLNMTMASITTKDHNNPTKTSAAKALPPRLTEIEEAPLAGTTTGAGAVGNEEKNTTEIDKSAPALADTNNAVVVPDFEL